MIIRGMEKLIPDLDDAMHRFSIMTQHELFGVIAHTGGFLNSCDTRDDSLFPKIDIWLTEHVAALLLLRGRETHLPQGLPEDSLSIPPELRVLRNIEHKGATALSEYCHFYADEWGSGAVRLTNQWEALADVTSTLSEVPRKLPVKRRLTM